MGNSVGWNLVGDRREGVELVEEDEFGLEYVGFEAEERCLDEDVFLWGVIWNLGKGYRF